MRVWAANGEWRFYLDYMTGFEEKVVAYTDRLDQTAFVTSECG